MHTLYDFQRNISYLSEVKLDGTGGLNIKVPSVDGRYWFCHSGPESPVRKEPAVASRHRASSALSYCQPISSKIDEACFKSQSVSVTVAAIYTPTPPFDSGTKDEFYGSLQTVANHIPKSDILSIANDWHAQTGAQDPSTGGTLGKFGLSQRCENEDKLTNFDFNGCT